MSKYAKFLVSVADRLDLEGKYEKADEIDNNFQEFLDMLENGELTFDFTFEGGQRPSNCPYNNGGSGTVKYLHEIQGN